MLDQYSCNPKIGAWVMEMTRKQNHLSQSLLLSKRQQEQSLVLARRLLPHQ
jgi:hypothetical protein